MHVHVEREAVLVVFDSVTVGETVTTATSGFWPAISRMRACKWAARSLTGNKQVRCDQPLDWETLSQEFGNHPGSLNARDALVESLEAKAEAFVVDAQALPDGRI